MDLLDKIISTTAKLPQQQLSKLCFVGAGIIALYMVAQISWQLVPVSEDSQPWRPIPMAASDKVSTNISPIENLNLFGRYNDQPVAAKPVVEPEQITNAPKTSLSIQLVGVVASTAEQNGLAVIDSRGNQNTYSIGDKIKGTSASLKEVYADRIIISNAGRYETLMLDGMKYEAQTSANSQLQQAKANKPQRIDQRNNKQVSAELKQSRDELLADPSKITDYLSISPVRRDGQVAGYRLNPGKDRKLFAQAGLKANDLVKSINGYDLTNNAEAIALMAELPTLTDASLMIERDGQLVEIMFSLPQ